MLFDGVLLASDYDGTLVPADGKMTPGARRALAYFTENGGRFTVSTGRVYRSFLPRLPDYINAPVLLANGALFYDFAANRKVSGDEIGDEGVEPFRALAEQFPDTAVELHHFDRCYVLNSSPVAVRHLTGQRIPFAEIGDPAEASLPWMKVMLFGSAADICCIQTFLAENCANLSFIPTRGECLEVMKKGVNKGRALLRLAEELKIERRHIYAVGDGYNDVEMLRAAQTAFVPANGDEAARACADYTVRSNEEDAIADVVALLTERYRNAREL